MNQEKRFSDEFLNAFVDNQIAAEEKSRVYIEIGQDEGVAAFQQLLGLGDHVAVLGQDGLDQLEIMADEASGLICLL